MSKAMTMLRVVAAAATVVMPITTGPVYAQSSSGTSSYTPPPGDHGPPPSGPPRSRMPLVDPQVVPPGSGIPNAKSTGTPGHSQQTDNMHGRRTAPPTPSRSRTPSR